jgi:hypothetical protein
VALLESEIYIGREQLFAKIKRRRKKVTTSSPGINKIKLPDWV